MFHQRRQRKATGSNSFPQEQQVHRGGWRNHARLDVSAGDVDFPVSAVGCNKFLMGGQFYPGKDKKRRQLRRRTLWYKIFCSSSWRQAASSLLVCYVLVWHVLLPSTEWLLKIGQRLSHPRRSAANQWILRPNDLTLNVPPLKEQLAQADDLHSERMRLRTVDQEDERSIHGQTIKILQSIVPNWYPRRRLAPKNGLEPSIHQRVDEDGKPKETDPKETNSKRKDSKETDTKDQNHEKEVIHDEKDGIQRKESEKIVIPDEPAVENGQVDGHDPAKPAHLHKSDLILIPGSKPTVTTVKSTHDMVNRTLQNMDSVLDSNSNCPSNLKSSQRSTTLVLQTSVDRLWIVNETCLRWKDPIVVVVFIPKPEPSNIHTVDEFAESAHCPNVHMIKYIGTEEESNLERFPVNRLRNVALDAVSTSHILVVDVDFLPSQDLHDTIRTVLEERYKDMKEEEIAELEHKDALVVPAFDRDLPKPCESVEDCASHLRKDSSFIPHSFDDLATCARSKNCTVFQRKFNWEGHFSTRSEEWLRRDWFTSDGKSKQQLKEVTCFHTARYEPYVVIRWCPVSTEPENPVAPYYDERFHGYGKNKIQLISHLRALGYRFPILPEGFIVHNPHPESSVKETWNDKKGSSLHGSMDKLYSRFLKELQEKYRGTKGPFIGICESPGGGGKE